jgi:hypothetical protein
MRMPGARHLFALSLLLILAAATPVVTEVAAQVGYGRHAVRPKAEPDTAGTAAREAAEAAAAEAAAASERQRQPEPPPGLPPGRRPPIGPLDSLQAAGSAADSLPGAADSLAATAAADSIPFARPAPDFPAVTEVSFPGLDTQFPAGPPDEAHLVGPPIPVELLTQDPTDRGRFGAWQWVPNHNRREERQRLGWYNEQEIPSRYLLRAGTGGLSSDVDLDLNRGVVVRTSRFESVVLGRPLPEDLDDFAYECIFAGRWQDTSAEMRNMVRQDVEAGYGSFGEGGGFTLEAPVPLGPAESILGSGASITIRGQERISVSGTSRWDANPPQGENVRQSKFPQLDLRQDLNITVDGKVGDKVSIDWSENSNQDTPLSNRIAIRYEGYEDEVVKSVDLGNTNLSLPGTQFVSYNGQHQGLFGIKATSQFGDLGLTMIASKQEGQTASNRFVGYAQETSRPIFDIDYVQRRFFFLVDPVDPLLTGEFLALDEGGIPPPTITELQIWRDDRNQQNNGGAVPGLAVLNPVPGGDPGETIETFFDPLVEQEDFQTRNDLFTVTIGSAIYRYQVIDLLSPLGRNEVLAATFTATYDTPTGPLEIRYGSAAGADTVTAKILFLPDGEYSYVGENLYNPADPLYPVRRLELRNIYNLGTTNLDLESLRVIVRRNGGENPFHFPQDEAATYLRGLGADREDVQGQPTSDDLIDRQYVYPSLGLIILPDLRPFAPAAQDTAWPFYRVDLPEYRPAGTEVRPAFFVNTIDDPTVANPAAYDRKSDDQDRGLDRRYFLDVTYKTPQTQFTLPAPGTILEDSEVVEVNGERLQRGSDYTIDYESGFVNLTGQTRLPEDAQVSIDYAYAPLFALGQKTLMGFHAGWDPGIKGRRFGTTWLFESAGTSDRRPKLGEEPSRTIVGDLNGGFRSNPPFLNRLVDAIPGVRANQDSRFDFTGELGLSLPDPNTKDQVYIDDFEGVKDNSILSLQRGDWFWSAIPDSIERDSPLTKRRGNLIWYNPVTSPARLRDLFPELEEEEGDDRKSVLILEIDPRVPVGDTDSTVVDPGAWVGLTQGISANGADYDSKQFIEIWINDFQDPELRGVASRPLMHIDLGVIREDAQWKHKELPHAKHDTEDLNRDGVLDRSDEFFEDTGLDSLLSEEEPGYNPTTNRDPNDDDFDFDRDEADEEPNDPRFFERVNRFEGNSQLDDEDVNRDATWQRNSDYIQYTVDLSDSLFVVTDVCKEFGQCGSPGAENGINGWRLFRIPIEAGRAEGTPNLGSVRHLRIWFTGFPKTKLIQIGGIDILGNLYKEELLHDATGTVTPAPGEEFKVRAINNKEDANEYEAPFELEERNRVIEREQSLAIDFLNLQPGNEASAFRGLANDRDLTLYETLKWYVYGGSLQGQSAQGVEAFVRLGADTLNYYEYAVPVGVGWSEEEIPLTELAALKLEDPDSCAVSGVPSICYSERRADGRLLSYVGQPSFTRARRLSFGVRNVDAVARTGSVWFDDLRLDDVIRDKGTATRFELTTGFADLMTVSANLTTRDEDFLSIGSGGQRTVTRGSGTRQRNYGIRSTMNLHKFAETSGVSLPFAFNYSKNTEEPEFRAGNDIVLSEEESARQERGSEQRGYSLAFSRQGRTGGILRYTLDAVRADFSLNDRRSLTQTRRDSARTINVGLAYSAAPNLKPLKIGGSEIRYFPDNITLGARMNSSRNFSYNRDLDDPSNQNLISAVYQKDAVLNGSTSLTLLRSLRSGYRIDSRRDLTFDNPADWLGGLNIGHEIYRQQNIDLTWTPPLSRHLQPNLSFRGNSRDDHNRTLQLASDSEQVRNLAASQTLSASFNVPITLLTGQGAAIPPGDTTAGAWRRFHAQIGRVGRFQDVRVSLSANNSRDFTNATGVPRWLYQLGLSTHPSSDVELTDRGRETSNESRTAQLSTGFEFKLGIGVTSSYSWSRRETEQTFTTQRNDRTVTWPQFDIDWRSFQTRIPKLDRVFRSLNLESRYTHDRSESGPAENESQNVTKRSDWNPLLGVNGSLTSGWSLRSRVSSTTTDNNNNEAGLGRFDKTTSRRYQVSMTRRFDPSSGLKLPWRKEPIKLRSDLTLNIDVTFSTDRSENGRRGVPAQLNRDTSTTSIRTGTAYKFRKNISGDFSVNLGRNNNNKTGQKLRTITLNGSLIFNF